MRYVQSVRCIHTCTCPRVHTCGHQSWEGSGSRPPNCGMGSWGLHEILLYPTVYAIGPSFWNAFPSSLTLTLQFGSLLTSLSLFKIYFSSRGLRTGSATE